MSRIRQSLLAVCLVAALPVGAATLHDLSDDELEAVSGREGVIVGLEMYYNAQKSATTALDGTAIGGTAVAPDGNCTGTNCRIALQLVGREARNLDNTKIGGASAAQAVQGEWLVIKDAYFALKMPSLYLDASLMGSGTNAALSSAAAYESFFDIGRFQNPSGGCLLTDGTPTGTLCTVANIRNTPALAMRHANSSTSYNTTTGVSSGYDSLSLSLKIGRMAVEYDTAACSFTGGASCGYTQDAKGSFLGLHIRDNNAPFAGIAVGGKMYLYGF